ncbi:hypothetical protein [Enterococcus phoeniculicola]|uniref:Uncharacterized protein n=1 Tax=Enterococcus phoeniculicola ATCC BAA-412 TaxID=1158610 RepID=R3TKS6_9ENTE|nr:hypothetical protein [Enterococcus phoeniculicola]EOL42019.1 hypothetical protein UC3_02367 [Enterococcus phoeniculicola ATCC BAA-412]EOT79702.1 hypothetical protein I589_01214 [Enterococcus phoeniculicola ATCC BAA-412]
MSEKLSKLFHEFVYENDCNGNEEIIAETNEIVAGEDIEAGTMLDDRLGEKYFYKCMDLAENVIKSFEDEQPQLNDNQQALLLWMKETECETDDPLEPISDLFLEGTPSKYFPDLELSCVEAAYQSLNKIQKIGLVQEYLRQAQEQEEEHD